MLGKFFEKFTSSLDQKEIFEKLITDEPYFYSLATMNFEEIEKNLLSLEDEYKNVVSQDILKILNLRYEIGAIISCFLITDQEQLKKILNPTFDTKYESQSGITLLDLYSYNKHFECTDLIISNNILNHFKKFENLETFEVPKLYKKDNYGEMRFYLITIMQTYFHLKKKYQTEKNIKLN